MKLLKPFLCGNSTEEARKQTTLHRLLKEQTVSMYQSLDASGSLFLIEFKREFQSRFSSSSFSVSQLNSFPSKKYEIDTINRSTERTRLRALLRDWA